MPDRGRSIRIPVTDDEIRMAHELAEQAGTSLAKFVRAMIRELHAERIAPKRRRAKARR